ncbi:MAG: hypothetical protein ACE5JP_07410 [Candidatus Bipolaricaulia bacterium]
MKRLLRARGISVKWISVLAILLLLGGGVFVQAQESQMPNDEPSIETWIKLLYTYGPFALLVFFLFVVEIKAHRAWRNTSEAGKVPLLIVYLVTWLVIFGLVGFSVYAWSRINLSSKPTSTIRGTFENLKDSEKILSRSKDWYLHRNYAGVGGLFDYEWLIGTPEQLKDGTMMSFLFDRSSPGSESWTKHNLTIRPSFYDGNIVRIVYERDEDKLFVMYSDETKELCPVNGSPDYQEKLCPQIASNSNYEELPALVNRVTVERAGLVRRLFVATAYAQEQGILHPEEITRFALQLESDDLIIRLDARADLASRGRAALPWIQEVLENPNSSYHLLLGVISALNQMSDPIAGTLSPDAIAAIIDLSQHTDFNLRAQARHYIDNHGL